MTETPDRTESIFATAAALATATERAAYLDQVCAGDNALRVHLEALLSAHERAGHLLDRPVPGAPEETGAHIPSENPGTIIAGRYKLLEEIGEGGMGTVWVAEQSQPVKRKVALKLIKAGMDSKSVLARFEAERQALAVMDHPNIAKVLDGGLTETGRPFFVMEYVKGIPITEYCDATRLSIPERLQLFAQVCSAVQHAHQKGIIHRDLKPSNILVAPYDDKPVPKVIDFGLAKAMHQSLTERTLHTAHETVLGTPLYMSPEQAQLNNLDVDTRSDIYSLGVLLYELLTGSTPMEKKRFKEAAWEEMKRLIREEEPPRPSMRLSSSQALPSLAAGRHSEPARLTKLVRGELDWIVMKALEKDRTRRYETANGFALDIQRYLAGEPVLAAPPSTRYRLSKFARKHGAGLATAAALALLLVAGVAVSSWQAVRATKAEVAARAAAQDALQAQRAEADRAEGERLAKLDAVAKKTDAENQQRRAEVGEKLAGERLVQVEAEKKKAEQEKQIAQAVMNFLQNKLLAQTDTRAQADALLEAGASSSGAKLNPTIRELLDRAAKELAPGNIEQSFPKQPLVQAEILGTVGRTYQGIGEYPLALDFLERAAALCRQHLGAETPETLIATGYLATAYRDAGKLDLALLLFEETLKLQKAKLGPQHPETLNTMGNLAEAYRNAGKLDLALPLLEETLKLQKAMLGPDHPLTLNSMNNLALAYHAAGKLEAALPLFEETLKLEIAKLGPDHPNKLSVMNNLAGACHDAGKLDLALPLFEETLKIRKAILGTEHPKTLTSMNNLAMAYHDAGKLDLALPLFEETLKIRKVKLGTDHPDTLSSMNNLAVGYQAAGKLDLALPLMEESLKLLKAKLGPGHPETLIAMGNLAFAYKDAGKLDLALPILRDVLTLSRKVYPKNGPQLAQSLARSGLLLLSAKAFDEAEPLLRECLAIREKTHADAWTTFNTKSMLGAALLGQKKHAEAEPLLLAGYEGMKKREKTIPLPSRVRMSEAIERLVQLYGAIDRKDEVAKWRAELDAIKSAEKKP